MLLKFILLFCGIGQLLVGIFAIDGSNILSKTYYRQTNEAAFLAGVFCLICAFVFFYCMAFAGQPGKSRILGMGRLWLDAKEAELKKRAGKE